MNREDYLIVRGLFAIVLILASAGMVHAQVRLPGNSLTTVRSFFEPPVSSFGWDSQNEVEPPWQSFPKTSTTATETSSPQDPQKPVPSTPPPPAPQSMPRTWKSLPTDILHDQVNIWDSPTKIRQQQLKWFAPFAAATIGLLVIDERGSRTIGTEPGLQHTTNQISRFGDGYSCLAVAGTFSLLGELTRNDHVEQTGLLSLEAFADSGILVEGLKLMAQRSRPSANNGEGRFWSGGSSFPSGHAITTFAIASAIGHQYPDNPWIRYGALGWATVISLSRVGGRQHFPSDVLVGATLGYLVGRYVTDHADSQNEKPGHSFAVRPFFSQLNGGYGISVSYGF